MNVLTNYIINNIKPFKTAIFAVFIAITASFGVSVISSAGKQLISYEMNAMGLDGMTASVYNTDGENSTDITFYNTLTDMNDVLKISPIICNAATIEFSNEISEEIMGWGIDADIADIISLKLTNGRMLTNRDIENKSYVCLIDKNIAETVYKRSNICGKNIMLTIDNCTACLTIVGVVEKGSNILNSLTQDIVPGFVYIPYTTMSHFNNKSSFDQVIFTSNDSNQTVSEFKQKLVEENYRYKNYTVKLTNLATQKEQIFNISDIAFFSLFMVSCVAVFVCSMSVSASVNTAVLSKYKDIGIKISMGASRWNIAKEFLIAAVLSCVLGIFAALIFTSVGISVIRYIVSFNFNVDCSLILLSIFATIFLTIIFSIMPSYKAARMSPIKALNRE